MPSIRTHKRWFATKTSKLTEYDDHTLKFDKQFAESAKAWEEYCVKLSKNYFERKKLLKDLFDTQIKINECLAKNKGNIVKLSQKSSLLVEMLAQYEYDRIQEVEKFQERLLDPKVKKYDPTKCKDKIFNLWHIINFSEFYSD